MAAKPPILALLQAARLPVVTRYLGQFSLALAAVSVVPTVVAALLGELRFALALGVGVVLPAALLGLGARLPRPSEPLQSNEALAVTALGFLLAAILMAWPMHFAGLPLLDALFESISGVTTTGLTAARSVADKPAGFLFARAWMQWYGGLGFAVMALALLSGQGAENRRLVEAAGSEEDLVSGTKIYARGILAVYLTLTSAGFIALLATGAAPFDALLHTLSGVSTGGFSNHDRNIAALAQATQVAALLLAFCGALPLLLFLHWTRHGPGDVLRDLELRALIVAIVLGGMVVWASGGISAFDAWAQAASAQTGTGFSTQDIAQVAPSAKWALILSMLLGGGVGSTAGGIKILRLLLLLRLVQVVILRAMLPRHAVVPLRLANRTIPREQMERVAVVVTLFLAVIVGSWLPFLAAGYEPLDALFEVVSATATVGLSTGITAPDLAPGLKAVLCADMLLGRLEVLALLVTVYPRTWITTGR